MTKKDWELCLIKRKNEILKKKIIRIKSIIE